MLPPKPIIIIIIKEKKTKKTEKVKKDKKDKKRKDNNATPIAITKKTQSTPKNRLQPNNNNFNPLSDAGDDDCPPSPAQVISPRANESFAEKTNFRVYSHNVNGLRDEAKLEYIPRLMEKKKIDAYLIQETHLAGDFEKKFNK